MAISFVGAGSFASGVASPLTSTLPSHSEGDLILLFVLTRRVSGSSAPTVPAGYEVLSYSTADVSGDRRECWIYGKFAAASESDPQVSSGATLTNGWAVQTFVYSGVHADILDTGFRWTDNQNQTGDVAIRPSRSATDGAVAVAVAGCETAGVSLAAGQEEGFTQRAANLGDDVSLVVADRTVASAGSITGPTIDQTAGNTYITLGMLTLLPSGSSPSGVRLMSVNRGLNSTSSSPENIPLYFPSVAEDDLIVVRVGGHNASEPTVTLTGYTQDAFESTGGNRWFWVYHKVSDGSDTQVTVQYSASNRHTVAVEVWRGVDPDTPIDVTSVTSTGASSTAFTGPSITPVTDGAVVQSSGMITDAPNVLTLDTAQSFGVYSPGWQWRNGGGFPWVWGADRLVASAAATTAPTWGINAARTWIGATTALRPLAASPPDAPGNPAATALSSSTIRVTWDNVADETGFRVERSPNGTTGWADVSGNLAADTVTYDDTGLDAATTYYYRVYAFNDSGDSDPSTTVNATTTGGGNRIGGDGAIRRSPR